MMTKSTTDYFDLEGMHFDELWLLHQKLTKILAKKITAEKLELDNRLARLSSSLADVTKPKRERRKYPKVVPKYFNPEVPTETWAGRGKQPIWLVSALRSGRKLEEFRIGDRESPSSSRRKRGS